MGPVVDPGQSQAEPAAAGVRPAPQQADVPAGSVSAPERVMALQRAVGNAAVARLAGGSGRGDEAVAGLVRAPLPGRSPSAAATGALALRQAVLARRGVDGDRPTGRTAALTAPARPERRLSRGFWGKVWGGIKTVGGAVGSGVKTAAVAVAGAVKDAATWVYDGAKKVGKWAVDWISSAGQAVWDAMKWFGSGAWDVVKTIGTWLFEKLALLGSLAWDFVRFLPLRLWRLIIQGWGAVSGLLHWLWKGVKGGVSWAWAWSGFKAGLNWCLETFIRMLELFGITDALQFVWGLIFHTRNLKQPERDASELVHGKHLIPYWQVRVDEGSFMVKLGKWINKIKDPNAQERALTTMHIIQAPKGIDLETTVHELTHVAQYRFVGSVYMPQALHGQASDMGYDYGDLTKARAEGRHYRDFNREQQAQMVEDYYVVKTTGVPGRYHATEAELDPYMVEMRRGEF